MTLSDDLEAMQMEVGRRADRILVVDDEALFGKAVVRRLERAGFECEHAVTLADAGRAVREAEPDLMLLDMRLPDGSGLDFLRDLRSRSAVPVIVMTAYGEVDDAVTAMKHDAADYLKKPVDLDELLVNVEKVLAASAVNRRLEYSQARESNRTDQPLLIGESDSMQSIRAQAQQIAAVVSDDAIPPTVLITGETGTGKDVTARLLHASSSRASRPFVHVDCAALPKDLIEGELFGHVKGAFTHAVSERTGLIEAAENGVVFLDEIGELPLDLQAKLLAVLERRRLRRVGSSSERETAAWFIAATNRDVEAMVADGSLRSDLYFRLNVLTLALPPLAARGNDVILLAEAFAQASAERYARGPVRFEDDALAVLRKNTWPGNVRELSHAIERAVLLAGDGVISAALLAPGATAPAAAAGNDAAALDGMTLAEVEQMMIERALAATDGNVSEAARRLGITRMAMRYRLDKYRAG